MVLRQAYWLLNAPRYIQWYTSNGFVPLLQTTKAPKRPSEITSAAAVMIIASMNDEGMIRLARKTSVGRVSEGKVMYDSSSTSQSPSGPALSQRAARRRSPQAGRRVQEVYVRPHRTGVSKLSAGAPDDSFD